MNKKKPSYNKNKIKKLKERLGQTQDRPPQDRSKRDMSNLEQIFADMLDELNIEWEREKPLKYLQGYRYYDFHLVEHGILIEIDGAYWHGDSGKPSHVTMMAKKNDYIKNFLAKKRGYELIRIKEKELLGNYDLVKENISLQVGKQIR